MLVSVAESCLTGVCLNPDSYLIIFTFLINEINYFCDVVFIS